MNDIIQIITISRPNFDFTSNERTINCSYYRLSIFEFKGDPLKAQFKEDLNMGFWDYRLAKAEAQKQAKERNILFVPDISMGDSVEIVFKQVLS